MPTHTHDRPAPSVQITGAEKVIINALLAKVCYTDNPEQHNMTEKDWALDALVRAHALPVGGSDTELTAAVASLCSSIEKAPERARPVAAALVADTRHPGWVRLLAALIADDPVAVSALARHTASLAGRRMKTPAFRLPQGSTAWQALSPLRRARLAADAVRLLHRPLSAAEVAALLPTLVRERWFTPMSLGSLVAWNADDVRDDLNCLADAVYAAALSTPERATLLVCAVRDSDALNRSYREQVHAVTLLRQATRGLTHRELVRLGSLSAPADTGIALLANDENRKVAALVLNHPGGRNGQLSFEQRSALIPILAQHRDTQHLVPLMVVSYLSHENWREEQEQAAAAVRALAGADTSAQEDALVEHWVAGIIERADLGLDDLSALHRDGLFTRVVTARAARRLARHLRVDRVDGKAGLEHASVDLLDAVVALPHDGVVLPEVEGHREQWLVEGDQIDSALMVLIDSWNDGPAAYSPRMPVPGQYPGLEYMLCAALRQYEIRRNTRTGHGARGGAGTKGGHDLEAGREHLTRWLRNISAADFRGTLQRWADGATADRGRGTVDADRLPAPLADALVPALREAEDPRAHELLVALLGVQFTWQAALPGTLTLAEFARSLNHVAQRGALLLPD